MQNSVNQPFFLISEEMSRNCNLALIKNKLVFDDECNLWARMPVRDEYHFQKQLPRFENPDIRYWVLRDFTHIICRKKDNKVLFCSFGKSVIWKKAKVFFKPSGASFLISNQAEPIATYRLFEYQKVVYQMTETRCKNSELSEEWLEFIENDKVDIPIPDSFEPHADKAEMLNELFKLSHRC